VTVNDVPNEVDVWEATRNFCWDQCDICHTLKDYGFSHGCHHYPVLFIPIDPDEIRFWGIKKDDLEFIDTPLQRFDWEEDTPVTEFNEQNGEENGAFNYNPVRDDQGIVPCVPA